MSTSPLKYTRVAIGLHWLMAVLMIYMLFLGEDMIRAREGELAANPNLHVSLGLALLILAVVRLAWRFMNPPPPDVPMSDLQTKASHALHWAFYIVMILIPISGMASLDHSITGRHPEFAQLTFFGLFTMPHFALSLLGEAHEILTKVAIGLLILHVVAALKHQFVDKDGLMRRMMLR